MNKTLTMIFALAVAMGTALAQAEEVKGDAKAAEGKIAMCIGCHGIIDYKTAFPEVYRVPMNYPFREPAPIDGKGAADRAILQIEKQIGADAVAAILIEPVQGEGGFIVPEEGFLGRLSEWATENGVVFIADEVQAGFCRTGAWFSVDHENVAPDLITTAKGIAGGMPLSAVTGRAELMDAVGPGGLGGTYGGNPVACAAALGSIQTMEEWDLNGRAQAIERQVREALEPLVRQVDIVGEVRGRGAMMALEFVSDASSKAPHPSAAKEIAAYCLERGVLILTCGTYGNVIRLLPPLTIGEELLGQSLQILADGIREVAGR